MPRTSISTDCRAGLAGAQAQLKLWDQCGGQGGSCNAFACVDGPFPGQSCPAGSSCLKQSKYYYQCLPSEGYTCIPANGNGATPSGSSGGGSSGGGLGAPQYTLGVWDQCGGLGGNCQTYGCVDGAYAK